MGICKVKGCENEIYAKSGDYPGYCKKHYSQVKRKNETRICKVKNCNGKQESKGYCGKHLAQLSRYGRILDRTSRDFNEIRIKSDICYMDLYNKNNEVVAITKFSLCDLETVNKYKWCMSLGYAVTVKNKHTIRLNRLIMGGKVLAKYLDVDHINRDKLNNCRSNLRVATKKQNGINNNSRGYCFFKPTGDWVVRLGGKYIGYYKTEEKAKQKSKKVRRQRHLDYFGEVETFIN